MPASPASPAPPTAPRPAHPSGTATDAPGADAAIRNAVADAGLSLSDVDGMMSYYFVHGDSTFTPQIAGDLGIRPNFYMDVQGGGSSTEALVGLAIGAIEAGMCEVVVLYRAMNGFSQVRPGGKGARAVAPVVDDMLHTRAYGMQNAAHQFAFSFMRHMHDYGTRPEQVAMVKVVHSEHASNNPKALYPQRVTVADVLASRMAAIAERVQSAPGRTRAADLIERVAREQAPVLR